MFGLGTQELMIILLIVVLIFGAGKLPQIGRGMGEAIKNFKKASKEAEDAIDITPEDDKKKIDAKAEKEEDKKDA